VEGIIIAKVKSGQGFEREKSADEMSSANSIAAQTRAKQQKINARPVKT